MKAVAVFPGEKTVKVIDDAPEPVLERPSDVKIKILEVGLCGTDRDIAQFSYGTPPPGSNRLIVGHESFGKVVETGPAVKDLKPGDYVVTMVRRPCPRPDCIACRSGRQDFCYTGVYTERGIKEQNGFLTEYIVDDQAYIVKVPAELKSVGVLTEPLTIAEKGLEQLYEIQQRLPWGCRVLDGAQSQYCHTALVIGAGPVGLLGALLFMSQSFKTFVYSLESDDSPQAHLVRSIGAEYYSSKALTPEQVVQKTGNLDVVYEATGAAKVAFEVMRVVGVNGVFIFTGVPGVKEAIELNADVIMKNLVLKNQVVYGTVNAGRKDFENAVRDLGIFMEKWPNAVKALITARHPMEEFPDLVTKRHPGIKHVISVAQS